MADAKLKVYVGRTPGGIWWWEIALAGRTRVQDDDPEPIDYGTFMASQQEALTRGLAALAALVGPS